ARARAGPWPRAAQRRAAGARANGRRLPEPLWKSGGAAGRSARPAARRRRAPVRAAKTEEGPGDGRGQEDREPREFASPASGAELEAAAGASVYRLVLAREFGPGGGPVCWARSDPEGEGAIGWAPTFSLRSTARWRRRTNG
ncbi:unnamed protein product, partial [Prorocentrum cordatum]